MIITNSLTWSLVVSTYRREKILPMALDLAVRQTRPPREIIVVDASENWEQTREAILSTIAPRHPDSRWIYVQAEHRSLTLQRNQGVLLATSDILFLIDDDSLMYPDCAERIMEVYEADHEHKILGVESNVVDQPPLQSVSIQDARQKVGVSASLLSLSRREFFWKHRFLSRLFIMDTKDHFIPYEGYFRDYPVPESVKKLNVTPVRIFDGFRMTYRREIFAKENFEPLFLYYAVAEDSDLSYRVSRHGALVMAVDARLHHYQSRSGRLSIRSVAALAGLNMALCLRKHSNNLRRDQASFYRLVLHLMFAQSVRDLTNRRWSLPRLRGLLLAVCYAPKLFAMSDQNLTEWYPKLQRRLIKP
jgi:glycosyltransferase involved in cell wall biosynthesis